MPPRSPADLVADLGTAEADGVLRPLSARLDQLRALRRMLSEQGDALVRAIASDLGRHELETRAMELGVVRSEIDQACRHLSSWVRPRRVRAPLYLQPARAHVELQPLGVVLVIGPWNYPVQLTLTPLIGALAAGNAVVLKPSEVAPATSAALAQWLPRYLDPRVVQVVEGGAEETQALLRERFDHVFYTGNGEVGRKVLRAAAEHLTPVTLELGGRSPAYVDDTVDLATTARRLVWGRYVNAGQTCVAPDHVLATDAVLDRLVPHLVEAIGDAYGSDPRRSASYARIVSERHTRRLAGLLEGTTPVVGGQVDVTDRYVAPTVLRGLPADHPALAEEIFGPILPLVAVDGADDAIARMASGPSPLALYLFTDDERTVRDAGERVRSGGLGIGAPFLQVAVPGLPFGGVGASGTGRYHGRYSVETFSHHRAVLRKPLRPDTLRLAYPPYSALRQRAVSLLGSARLPGRRRAGD